MKNFLRSGSSRYNSTISTGGVQTMQKKVLNEYVDLIIRLEKLGNVILEEEVGGLIVKEADNLTAAADLLRENLSLNGIAVDGKGEISFAGARKSLTRTGSVTRESGRNDRPENAPSGKFVKAADNQILKMPDTASRAVQEKNFEEKKTKPEVRLEVLEPKPAAVPDFPEARQEKEQPVAHEEDSRPAAVSESPKADPENTLTAAPEASAPVQAAVSDPVQNEVLTEPFRDERLVSPEDDIMADVYETVCGMIDMADDGSGIQMPMTEESPEEKDPEKKRDIRFIREQDMTISYLAFRIIKKDVNIAACEVISAPINPADPSGRFFYWIEEINEDPIVGVSEVDDKGIGVLKYQLKYLDFYITLRCEETTRRHALLVNLPKRYGEIEYDSNDQYGTEGHVMLHDQGTTLHLFPTNFSNNEITKTADCVCVIEKDGKYTIASSKNGYVDLHVNDTNYKLSAAWGGDSDNYTFYSKIA